MSIHSLVVSANRTHLNSFNIPHANRTDDANWTHYVHFAIQIGNWIKVEAKISISAAAIPLSIWSQFHFICRWMHIDRNRRNIELSPLRADS